MFLHTNYPPDPRVENEATSLIQDGHQVAIFCLSTQLPSKKEVIKNIEVYRFQINQFTYKSSAVPFEFPFFRWGIQSFLSDFVKEFKPDALHVHNIYLMPALIKLNQKLNLPLLLDLHENVPEILPYYSHTRKIPARWVIQPKNWKLEEQKFAQMADKIVTVTEEAASDLAERSGVPISKFIVVPNTSTKAFTENAKIDQTIVNRLEREFIFLYVGDTGIRRGLLTAIRALYHTKSKSLALCIVGSNATDTILIEEAKQLGVEDQVYFEGWQPFERFNSYIVGAKVGICPLYRNIHHDTTIANKLFQYASYGKPLLVSDCTVQKRIVESYQCGLVHKEQDAEDMAEKMLLFLNEKRYEYWSNNAEIMVRTTMHWENTIKPLLHYYSALDGAS